MLAFGVTTWDGNPGTERLVLGSVIGPRTWESGEGWNGLGVGGK